MLAAGCGCGSGPRLRVCPRECPPFTNALLTAGPPSDQAPSALPRPRGPDGGQMPPCCCGGRQGSPRLGRGRLLVPDNGCLQEPSLPRRGRATIVVLAPRSLLARWPEERRGAAEGREQAREPGSGEPAVGQRPAGERPPRPSVEGVSRPEGGGGHSSRSKSPRQILHVQLDFENAREGDGHEDAVTETVGRRWQRRHFAYNGAKVRGCLVLVVTEVVGAGGRCRLTGLLFCGCRGEGEGRQA